MHIISWLALGAVLTVQCQGNLPTPVIRIKQWEILNKFTIGDGSRHILFSCVPKGQPRNVSCANENWIYELFDETTQTVLQSGSCRESRYKFDQTHDGVKIEQDNDTLVSARLRCRLLGENGERSISENSVTIPWLPCKEDSNICMKETQCQDGGPSKFCVVSQNGTDPCVTNVNPAWCASEDAANSRSCPMNELGYCATALRNRSAIWFRLWGDRCPQVSEPPFSYKGKSLIHNDVVVFDPAQPLIRMKCSSDSPLYNHSFGHFFTFSGGRRTSRVTYRQNRCIDELTFNLTEFDPEYVNRVDVVEISISTTLENGAEFSFKMKMLILGESTSISIREGRSYTEDRNALYCSIDLPYENRGFLITNWWTKKSTGNQPLDKKVSRAYFQWTLPAEHMTRGPDEYQCHAIIEYKTCLPFKKLDFGGKVIRSEKFNYTFSGP